MTASVDRLDLLAPLTADANYRLSGHVIYVGSSSMEVFVSIEQLTPPTQPNKICLTGRFTMAARNAHTLSSQRIAPLILETDAERALFAMGESHKNRKRAEAASSLEKVPPSKDEAFLLHSQYIRGLHAGMFANTDELHGPALKAEPVTSADGSTLVPVRRTSMSTTMHMHPQQRNVHQKIFGGFLMRSAYELAWMVSGKQSPTLSPPTLNESELTLSFLSLADPQHRWSTATCSSSRWMHSHSTLPFPSVRCSSSRPRSYTLPNQSNIHTATPSLELPCSPKSSTSRRVNAKRATPYVPPPPLHRP